MILVTVGTHPQPFNRLLKEIDELIERNKIKEKIVMQIGYSTYIPKNAKWFRFLEYEKMEKLIERSSIVITHAGIGSVLLSVRFRKPTIVVPRLEKFGEHTNDHQLQIANELNKHGNIIVAYDSSKIVDKIKIAYYFKPRAEAKNYVIHDMIKAFLSGLEEK